MAIIKKFNLALENIDADPNAEICNDSESEEDEEPEPSGIEESSRMSNDEI
jgi:hypothetical protein